MGRKHFTEEQIAFAFRQLNAYPGCRGGLKMPLAIGSVLVIIYRRNGSASA
jgi:hypothetical protein